MKITGSSKLLCAVLLLLALTSLVNLGCKRKSNRNGKSKKEKAERVEPKNDEIEYDFSCLEDEKDGGQGKITNMGNQLENDLLDKFGEDVTIEEEEEVGQRVYEEYKSDILVNEQSKRLEMLLKELVSQIPDPRGFRYNIYLLDNKEINAWTCGGYIFVTTKMMDFCESDDELACVIGHEINHNELGHLKHRIQKAKLMGDLAAGISEILTTPFGQKDEAHCDLRGIDLVYAAGYDGCVNVQLWKRMQEESEEGDYNAVINLFRSHPYSSKRSDCSLRHIDHNYDIQCE